MIVRRESQIAILGVNLGINYTTLILENEHGRRSWKQWVEMMAFQRMHGEEAGALRRMMNTGMRHAR
jgi:hypothetical protein